MLVSKPPSFILKFKTYLGLLSLSEESFLTLLLLGLVGSEVLWLRNLLDLLGVESGDVDLVGSGDDVARVDSSQGNAVDLERSGDEEDTLVEGLEEDDTLSTEASGQEDQNGTGLEGLAGSPGADSLADLKSEKYVSTDISPRRKSKDCFVACSNSSCHGSPPAVKHHTRFSRI